MAKIKGILHYVDEDNGHEVTVATSLDGKEVAYHGLINIAIRSEQGMQKVPFPFKLECKTLEEAFEIYSKEAEKAFNLFKAEQEARMREPKIVAPNGKTIEFPKELR